MRRRSKTGGEPTKAQRRKTGARKSRVAPKAGRPRNSSAAREETKVARLTRELSDARQQQTANALDGMKGDARTRAEIAELTDTLRDNLGKIVQHGNRGRCDCQGHVAALARGLGQAPARRYQRPRRGQRSISPITVPAPRNRAFKINLERSFDPDRRSNRLYFHRRSRGAF